LVLICLLIEGLTETEGLALEVVAEGLEEVGTGREAVEELAFGSFGIVNLEVAVLLNRPVPPGPILLDVSTPDSLVLVILIFRPPPELLFLIVNCWSELREYLVLVSVILFPPL